MAAMDPRDKGRGDDAQRPSGGEPARTPEDDARHQAWKVANDAWCSSTRKHLSEAVASGDPARVMDAIRNSIAESSGDSRTFREQGLEYLAAHLIFEADGTANFLIPHDPIGLKTPEEELEGYARAHAGTILYELRNDRLMPGNVMQTFLDEHGGISETFTHHDDGTFSWVRGTLPDPMSGQSHT